MAAIQEGKVKVKATAAKVKATAATFKAEMKGIGGQFVDLQNDFGKMSVKMDKHKSKIDGISLTIADNTLVIGKLKT